MIRKIAAVVFVYLALTFTAGCLASVMWVMGAISGDTLRLAWAPWVWPSAIGFLLGITLVMLQMIWDWVQEDR